MTARWRQGAKCGDGGDGGDAAATAATAAAAAILTIAAVVCERKVADVSCSRPATYYKARNNQQ